MTTDLTPNWYACVMGTGIVAVAAASLPVVVPGLRGIATGMWLLATVLLVTMTIATARQWRRGSDAVRRHAKDPVMAHFYGAPPMAMLTVGAGTLLLGPDLIGLRAALVIDGVLWAVGTVSGLASAVVVPYLLISRRRLVIREAFGGWLMPVVPPTVSASTGALLIPHLPSVTARTAMLVGCYGMLVFSVLASMVVFVVLGHRLLRYPAGPAPMVPTLLIVLGPLGQSITAANLLGGVAPLAVPGPKAAALQAFGVGFGIPVFVVAMLWLGGAAIAVTRTARRDGLPFSLTWWSFTFPVGTCVTAAGGLALHTGSAVFVVAAVTLFVGLVAAWLVVMMGTANATLRG